MTEMPAPSPTGRMNTELTRRHEEHDPTDDPEDPLTPRRREERRLLDEALSAFFSKGVPVLNGVLVLPLFFKMRDHNSTSAQVRSAAYVACLALVFYLHCVEAIGCRLIQQQERWWRCVIAYASIALRMVAAFTLLLFLDGADAIVALPVLLVALAFVAYFSTQTFSHAEYRPWMNWVGHKEELKKRAELSAQVASMAFGGLSGTVLGSVQNASPPNSNLPTALRPESFLFCSVVLSLLALLLTTVPTRVEKRRTRSSVARAYIPCLAYFALLCLVAAAAEGAAMIQVEYLFLVCFAVAVAIVLFAWCHESAARPVEAEQAGGGNKVPQLMVVSFTTVFGALMAAYSKYSIPSGGSTVPQSWWFKGFVSSALCTILSYAILVVVFSDISRPWPRATYGAVGTAVVCAAAVGIQNPGEVKNIFV